ncbi:hypothetical protein [Humibacillus xanthopallidus]|uniref:hypothetical protein n=1 Tax=Humibacillus xanthopallidus TaxID=412689 RepID=UPI00384D88ED
MSPPFGLTRRLLGRPASDPWQQVGDLIDSPIDWQGVWAEGLHILREVNEVAVPQMARRSQGPLIDSAGLAVDVWVDADLHAGSFPLGDTTSVVLRGGMVAVTEQFGDFVAAMLHPARGRRPSEELIDAVANWMDHAASPCDKFAVPTGPSGPWQEEAPLRSRLALAFVMCHELAHVYVANVAGHAHEPDWAALSPRERTCRLEYEADATGFDALLAWLGHDSPGMSDGAVGRLSYMSAWTLLTGVGLLETFEPALRPATYPTAQQRLTRLHGYVRERYGDHTRSVDALGPDVDMVLAEACRRQSAQRQEAGRAVDELVASVAGPGRVSEARAGDTLGSAYLVSGCETLRRIEDLFAHPDADPDERARQMIWNVLGRRVPAAIWNSFSNRIGPYWITEWEMPRRRVRLGAKEPEETS